MNSTLEFTTIALRLFFAALFGLLIGMERNKHGRPAGMRTHLLVSLGSASFVLLSILIPEAVLNTPGTPHFIYDPARISAQIVTGIGFLGAGVIIKDGTNVRGLTTAATLWVSASIGMASGGGYILIAGFLCALALLSVVFLPWVEGLYKKDSYFKLSITLPTGVKIDEINQLIQHSNASIVSMNYDVDYSSKLQTIKYNLNIPSHHKTTVGIEDLVVQFEHADFELINLKWNHV